MDLKVFRLYFLSAEKMISDSILKHKKIIPLFSFLLIIIFSGMLVAGITADQKVLNEKVKNFYGLDSLPPKYQGGFVYQLAVREIYNQLSSELKKTFDKMVALPSRQDSAFSPTGRFIMHFDRSGPNAVPAEDLLANGIPDFIDSAGVFLDYCWQIEVEQLGYRQPLGSDGQPVLTYAILFTNLSDYGFTHVIDALGDGKFSSYIEMDNDFQSNALYTRGLDGLRVTCAHELHHAIQLSYRFRSKEIFIFEMTGTWIEEIVYSDINDYFQYLPHIFNNYGSIALTGRDFRSEYGNSIFLHMLSQKYGQDIVRQIWERLIIEEAPDALNSSLEEQGGTFKNALNDYGKWMYFTGDRSLPSFFYAEADSYPQITINNNFIFTGNENYNDTFLIRPYSFNYFKAERVRNVRSLLRAKPQTAGSHIRVNFFNEDLLNREPTNGSSNSQLIVNQTGKDIIIAVSNSSDKADSVYFSFIADTSVTPDSSAHNQVAFGPNPVKVDDGKPRFFYAVPARSEIIIMDLNQKPVKILKNSLNTSARLQWDLKDSNGQLVNSGVYFYVSRGGNKNTIGKIAVVH